MADTQRVDKWLWFARFFKSRTLAAKLCAGSRLRINRQIVSKASATVAIGDVLTFPQGPHVRVVRIMGLGQRRGPPTEARLLYEDLAPPEPRDRAGAAGAALRDPGSGRPTKRDRRALDRLKQQDDDDSTG